MAALSMLASAVAGRAITVVPMPRPSLSYATAEAIFLDPRLSAWQARQAVMAQALLLAAGSLHEPGLTRLLGRAGVARRYMQWELARAVSQFAQRVPAGFESWLQRALWTPAPDSSARSLQRALHGDPERASMPWPVHLGVIRPSRLAWASLRGEHQFVHASQPRKASPSPNSDEPADTLTQKLLNWFSSPLGGGAVSQLFLSLLGLGTQAGGAGSSTRHPGGVATALGGGPDQSDASPGGDAEQLSGAPAAADAKPRADTAVRRDYPEWFEGQGRYRQNWVRVYEFAAAAVAAPTRPTGATASVRRQLARLGVALQGQRAQPEGPDFDLDALVRHAVEDRHSGAVPRLYRATRRTRRDLSLLVLMDISKSTGDQNSAGVSIIDQQRELARALTQACEQLGDRVGLYAFHSWGRHLVHCLRIKGFNERVSRTTHQRLNTLEPAGLTRLGAAIRHAAHVLGQETQHSQRVILLLSDGFAYDDEYEGRHAQDDTAEALTQAQAAGLGCVCLNIGSTQDDEVLKRLYGPSAYLRCADASRAVPALRRLLRGALRGAGHA